MGKLSAFEGNLKLLGSVDAVSIFSTIWGSVSKTITKDDIRTYSELLGDDNPIHLDEDYAKTTQFGRCIAHGLISGGLLPTMVGAQCEGAIYLSQTFKFHHPVYPGDTVTAKARCIRAKPNRMFTLETVVVNQDDKIVISGEAAVLVPQSKNAESLT